MTEDGDTLIYGHEVVGPDGKTKRHEIRFGLAQE
jgi:hypothetical protein